MERIKNILVTGGAGFIGSHTVDLLLQNDFRVVVFDNLVSGKLSNLDLFNPNLQFIPGDILDYPALAIQIKRCDAVIHLAALPSVPKSIEDPITSLRVNTQGFLHVLQAVREAGRPVRVVYASSAAIYGDTQKLPCEDEIDFSARVLSPYALEKVTDERYADLYMRLFGISCLGLRYFNVYGPRQEPCSPYSGVISKFISAYKNKEEIVIQGDGQQSRDFIYVNDVARANLAAVQSQYTGILNIATGVPETLLNLIKYIEEAGNTPAKFELTASRPGDIRESYAKIDKARQALAFQAEVSLKEGISKILQKM